MASSPDGPTPRIWDVVVIGSGPAGSAAAIAALATRPEASVLLLDRSEFPRDKCCGDAVFGAGVRELAAHGVDTAALLAGYRPVRDLRLLTASGIAVAGHLPEEMTVIPRAVFDDRLRRAAVDSGAAARRHSVRQVVARHDWVEIDGTVRAKIVIGADGAESAVRRAMPIPDGRRDVAIALRGYDDAPGEAAPVMVFDHRGGLAYAWRFPASRGAANVGYGHLLRPHERASRSELLATLQRLLPDVRPNPSSLRAHRLPLSSTRQPFAHGRILLAGDAAALVNPLSGEGIYYAIASGLAAGTAAVASAHPDHQYTEFMRKRFGRHRRHAGALARLTRSETILEAGIRAAGSRPAVFSDLVAIGLAEGGVTARFVGHLGWQLRHNLPSLWGLART